MLGKFGKLFKHYVGSGEVDILINGDLVQPYVPDTILEYDTEIKFDVNGKTVRLGQPCQEGWQQGRLWLRSRSPESRDQGARKDWLRTSCSVNAISGRAHLDDFPVTNNKTDFRVGTEEWAEITKRLAELLIDLKRESRKLANPGKQMTPKDQAEVEEHIEGSQGHTQNTGTAAGPGPTIT